MDVTFRTIQGNCLTIKEEAYIQLEKFRQRKNQCEAGGLLLGRTTIDGNSSIFKITEPKKGDIRKLLFFTRLDKGHIDELNREHKNCLYFKGNWHSHPQDYPEPSWVDIKAWKKTLKETKPGESNYTYFIIVGVKEISVWMGDILDYKIEKMGRAE